MLRAVAFPDLDHVAEKPQRHPPVGRALVLEQNVDERFSTVRELHAEQEVGAELGELRIDEPSGQRPKRRPVETLFELGTEQQLELPSSVLGLREHVVKETVVRGLHRCSVDQDRRRRSTFLLDGTTQVPSRGQLRLLGTRARARRFDCTALARIANRESAPTDSRLAPSAKPAAPIAAVRRAHDPHTMSPPPPAAVPLPRSWPDHVGGAFLCAVGLAHRGMIFVHAWSENSPIEPGPVQPSSRFPPTPLRPPSAMAIRPPIRAASKSESRQSIAKLDSVNLSVFKRAHRCMECLSPNQRLIHYSQKIHILWTSSGSTRP